MILPNYDSAITNRSTTTRQLRLRQLQLRQLRLGFLRNAVKIALKFILRLI
jgi:hypothetical protein